MSTDIQKQFERLEKQRQALFAGVEGLDDQRLNRRPGEGKWSVIQVMSHLIAAEEASLGSLRKEITREGGVDKAGFKATLRRAFLKLVLNLPLRFKSPARAAVVPDHQDLATTRRQWDEVRAGWSEAITAFPSELTDRGIFRHPVVGRLSLAQGLAFMEDHVARHCNQIDRIIAESA